ncbi:MAG: response regulator [Desulfobacterales bacterium]
MDSAVILIVDDERLFGDVVAQRLRQRGFAAVAVTSGLDALKRKRDREARIREVRSRPYISERERSELISKILDDA